MNEKDAEAVKDLKSAILKSQYSVALHTNAWMLSLYYSIGGYISAKDKGERRKTCAIEEICARLREEMPGLRGFSAENIKLMRLFYEEWQLYLQPLADIYPNSGKPWPVCESGLGQQRYSPVRFPIEAFSAISFSHHIEILRRTEELYERLFYIRACASGHWSLSVLKDGLGKDLYRHQCANSDDYDRPQFDENQYRNAISMFKDEHFLDFINTEELDLSDPQDVNERVLEKETIDHIRNFVQSLGSGFCFVGNQHCLKVGQQEFYADLLFYQRDLKALVVIELKKGEFKPGYLGYLNFYLAALDNMERKNGENPSIGLLLCREANRNVVELAIRDYSRPMGVATYSMAEDLPEKYKVLAPILVEVPRMLGNAEYEKGGER